MSCSNPDCAFAVTGECARDFEDPEADCPDLAGGEGDIDDATSPDPEPPSVEPAETSESEPPARLLPGFWSGLALGSGELWPVLSTERSRLITVMGDKDAGKSCLTTALYLALVNARPRALPFRFCGSRTLLGFHKLTDKAFGWRGGERRILPRTNHSSLREPSFLHLALAESDDTPLEVLITDMPGEWFEHFANTGVVEDTLAFLPRSDGVLLVVDSYRLLKEPSYRRFNGYLLQRLVDALPRVPVALALSKFDKVIREVSIPDADQREQPEAWGPLMPSIRKLTKQLQALEAPWRIFPCSAMPGDLRRTRPIEVLPPLRFLLDQPAPDRSAPPPPLRIPDGARYFHHFTAEERS